MKKTLIVVDMQNDFIHMALGTPEAVRIVPRVKEKIRRCLEEGWEIIYTRDTHGEDYLRTPEGRKLPVPHCIRGTEGWQIAEGLYVEGCKIIDKPDFGWPHWQEEDLQAVELIGLCTDICVVSNALIIKATFPEAVVSVDASCCAGVTPATHEAALTTMAMCQIDIIKN
ncbi:MAG: cysteine hydrolase [Oscillospiraceae bacterium]|nr:cysteine hydrolase [Oscillospiraceae bacterium]MBQ5711503.1 cysteine hydrolase [Oscillospiraceae bacterium]